MNRKLLNGLLVLTVAAGGVVTFTSCKDENFSDNVRLNQEALQAQIDAIRGLDDKAFYDNLESAVNGWIADYLNGLPSVDNPEDGKDGQNALYLTLTPQIISLEYNDEGKLIEGDYTSLAQVFDGNDPATEWTYSYVENKDLDYFTVTVDPTSGKITVDVTKIPADRRVGTVTIQAKKKVEDKDITLSNVLVIGKDLPDVALRDWLADADYWTSNWGKDEDGNPITNPYGWGYIEFVQAGVEMYNIYDQIMNYKEGDKISEQMQSYINGLYQMLFEKKIQSSDWYLQIGVNATNIANLLQRATSVSVNHVYNPVFGTINLPVGINSTVLATYVYKSEESDAFKFPGEIANSTGSIAVSSPLNYIPTQDLAVVTPEIEAHNEMVTQVLNVLYSLSSAGKDSYYTLPAKGKIAFSDPQEFGNMGGAVVAINPSSNNFMNEAYTVELVNSKGDVVLSSKDPDNCGTPGIELDNCDNLIYFGASRADNAGVYALKANANDHNWQKLVFDLDGSKSNIKNSLKQVVDNKKLSDIAHLGETVFRAVNNELPAYSVRVSWDEEDVEGKKSTNSVYSDFNLAATVVHPLSYNLHLGTVLNTEKRLPVVHNPLTYYLNKIKNRITIDLSLDVDINIEKIDLLTTFTGDGMIMAYVIDASTGLVAGDVTVIGYDNNDQPIYKKIEKDGIEYIEGAEYYIKLEYTADGVRNPDPNTFDEFINKLLTSIQDQVNDNVIAEVKKSFEDAISDINKQLQEVDAKLGEFRDLVDRVEKSKLLTYGQKLVDIYNDLADKANEFLADPNHYLQVMMAYSLGDGAHHMSNDKYYPITVNTADGGNSIELLLASYTGDVVVPSFKKYVAITGVVEANGTVNTDNLIALNQAANLNEVLPGHQMRCVAKVDGLKGKTVRLTYASVDYRGMVSMENYYLRVK